MNLMILCWCLLSQILLTSASSVIDLAPTNFDEIVLGSKPALVEFFAPWCGHCKNLAPVYEELATKFASASDSVIVAKVDADQHKSLGKRFGVQGFPTLKWFDGKSDKPEDYKGGRDLESLSSFITEKTGITAKAKAQPPSSIVKLNDASFRSEIGQANDVLVAFTAPWCGHCKNLQPTWESLARDFSSEPNVIIAKLDAEAEDSKETAKSEGVSSYPTIKFFPKNSVSGQSYQGQRSQEALTTFLNDNAGTYRTVGGKLNAEAGTVPVLDAVLEEVKHEGGSEIIATKLKEAARGLKGDDVEYYLKISDRISTVDGYVMKELERLGGILGKHGLAASKRDDITKRLNVLRKFHQEPVAKDEL